jgi:hypothetical protein
MMSASLPIGPQVARLLTYLRTESLRAELPAIPQRSELRRHRYLPLLPAQTAHRGTITRHIRGEIPATDVGEL